MTPPMTPSNEDPRPAGRRWRRRRTPITVAGTEVRAGRSVVGEVPIPRLVTGTPVSLPLRVVHGRHDGPTVLVSSTIHGDEIGGVEIVRRVDDAIDPDTLHGTLLLVPIVNVHGFLTGDRYLPDRRDLNRSFPGSSRGSLASRIARVFMDELVARCDVGIDLHTGSDHRTNLPQVRGDLDDPTTRDLAEAFGAPVMLHARVRDGSLRAAGTDAGVTMLLFEGGEALRFDQATIAAGTDGTLRVLNRLGMLPDVEPPPLPIGADGAAVRPVASRKSSWVRARRSGVTSLLVGLGDTVAKGDRVAIIRDAVGTRLARPGAPMDGIVIGHTQHPLVHQGDALVHVARIEPDAPTGPADVGVQTAGVVNAPIGPPVPSPADTSSAATPAPGDHTDPTDTTSRSTA